MLVKGELLNGSGGEEHLKLIEALRKTHTRSHNKKKKKESVVEAEVNNRERRRSSKRRR